MDQPALIPENGFYRHYKHDPAGEAGRYVYEVIGVGKHTEDGSLAVIYRPLYRNSWLAPASYCMRPLEMFMGTVEKDGTVMPRFAKVVDPETIARLREIRQGIYPS